MLPEINENININELTRLNDQLKKNSQVGYQSQSASSGFGAIVPQSIEGTLASATHTMQDLALWPMLPKVQVSNTLHEYAVIREHGQDLDPFIGESGGGANEFGATATSYERKSVKIKYMAERRQISDVATLVGIVGSNPNGLAEETERGTMSLMRKVEQQLFWGDEERDATNQSFDGILKQIERTGGARADEFGGQPFSENTASNAGAALDPTKLHDILGELHSAPRFGRPDTIMMEPRLYSQLIKQSVQNGRHDSLLMVDRGSEGVQTLGAGPKLHVMGPMGPVPVVSAPFLSRHFSAASAGSAAIGGAFTQVPVAAGAGVANWDLAGGATDNHNGFFRYVVVPVSKLGYGDPIVSVNSVQGDSGAQAEPIKFQVDNPNGAIYYRIYRLKPGYTQAAADALTPAEVIRDSKLIAEVPAAEIVAREFEDYGVERWGHGRIVFAQMDQGVVEFARLLDFLRRPLAETSSARQFLLMLFGSPIVKIPSKCFTLRDVPAVLV